MIDLRTTSPGELVRVADVMERLMARLPISRSQSVRETMTDGMSLQQVSNLYGRMCGDPGCFDDVVTVAETLDEPAPTAAARVPEPVSTNPPPPAAENVTTVPFSQPTEPLSAEPATPIEPEVPAAETLPADPRLRAFGLTTYCGAG